MIQDLHLIPIRPQYTERVNCPKCGSAVETSAIRFPGIHVLSENHCNKCGLQFVQDLKVGFAAQHPVAIDRKNSELFNISNAPGWYTYPLLKGSRSPSDQHIPIERIVHRKTDRIIILNCIDFLYGHVLLKLWNAQYYLDKHPDTGLVLILPKMFSWLVPKGTAEVWQVDLRLGQAHGWYNSIDRWVQERIGEYREIYMAKGYAHPDLTRIDMERFSGIKAFPLEEFNSRSRHITFIARQDRLWNAGPFGDLIFRAIQRMKLRKRFGPWMVAGQTRRIKRTMEQIRKIYPDIQFTVVGLDRSGGFEGLAEDLRSEKMDLERELAWCRAYAKSQVVVGVHGSNMLLPTAFAAGAVEILPKDRHGNMVQDIFVRYTNRMQLFMYRFVREHATPAEVADQCVAMLRDMEAYHRNMCVYTV